LLERALERDLELRGFRQSSLKSTRRFALRARVLLLLNQQAFRSFLRHVRLGIQQRALQGLVQGLRVVIDPSRQDGAMWVGEVILHEARPPSRELKSSCAPTLHGRKTRGHTSVSPLAFLKTPFLTSLFLCGFLR